MFCTLGSRFRYELGTIFQPLGSIIRNSRCVYNDQFKICMVCLLSIAASNRRLVFSEDFTPRCFTSLLLHQHKSDYNSISIRLLTLFEVTVEHWY